MKILETFSGLSYEITQEQADDISNASVQGNAKGFQLGSDYIAFASIKSIADLHDYHQPYTQPESTGLGFTRLIGREKKLSALVALAKGLKTAKAKLEAQGSPTLNIEKLLELGRTRYAAAQKRG